MANETVNTPESRFRLLALTRRGRDVLPHEADQSSAFSPHPGKAVEAEIGKEDGRTVFEVQIIDANKKTQKVYVDAQTGQVKSDK